MTTAADRHLAGELKRLERLAANVEAHPFERQHAQERLAKLSAPRTPSGWIDGEAICRWCEMKISTHIQPDVPRSSLGASLCPVVRDLSTAGAGPWERFYPTPTPEQAAAWRESNRPALVVKKPSRAERKADREARQRKLEGT